jgi:antitoxin component of MazEF toxin-antitoxin module
MRNCALYRNPRFFIATLLSLLVFVSACQQNPATNSTTTTNTSNVNANTSATNNNTGTPPIAGTTIEAREPDKYSTTITLRIESQGNGQTTSLPPLSADFIKNGADRRITFKVPGEQIAFLDVGSKRYIIATNRKQYAELTPESTGFDVPTVMTPGQIVGSVKGMSGCERQGEEQLNNRTATKYRCAGKSSTGTQAGDVSTEAFIYIDKETGLPLRSESVVAASGNVQGIQGLKLVTEMSNIKTDIDAALLAEPQGMSKVSPEQVKQQVNLVLQAALALANQFKSSMNAPPANSSATPAASASPSGKPVY